MTGKERIDNILQGKSIDDFATMPILHSALATMRGVPQSDYFTNAETMADVICWGYERFTYDGVQLSQGVTAEAEALGATVEQPANEGPILKQSLITDYSVLSQLERKTPWKSGRIPMFFQAVRKVMDRIGNDAFVLPTLRGPFLMATQLRGIERVMMDMIDCPDELGKLLDFATDVALKLGKELVKICNHGLLLGEAPCSPDMISPEMYRQLILPHHKRLVTELKHAGWRAVGLHICGNSSAIIEDVIDTQSDFLDVDHEVLPENAIKLARGKIALRGNLDPSSIFRFGTPQAMYLEVHSLRKTVHGHRWIFSSGCDIPPHTPEENIAAFINACHGES